MAKFFPTKIDTAEGTAYFEDNARYIAGELTKRGLDYTVHCKWAEYWGGLIWDFEVRLRCFEEVDLLMETDEIEDFVSFHGDVMIDWNLNLIGE